MLKANNEVSAANVTQSQTEAGTPRKVPPRNLTPPPMSMEGSDTLSEDEEDEIKPRTEISDVCTTCSSDQSSVGSLGSNESLDNAEGGAVVSKRKPSKPTDSSFTSVQSFQTVTTEKVKDVLDVQLKSIGNLPIRTSLWNDAAARKVYGSFKVKRFIIENNYILNPLGNVPSRNISNVLCTRENSSRTWSHLQKKLQNILQFYPDSAADLAYYLQDGQRISECVKDWKFHIRDVKKSLEVIPQELDLTLEFLGGFLNRLESMGTNPKKMPEFVFEVYLEFLFSTFGLLWHMGAMGFRLTPIPMEQISFTTPSLGELVCPKPDFYLWTSNHKLLAVVEVKPCHKQLCKSHKGHRIRPKNLNKDANDDEELCIDLENSALDGMPEELLKDLPDYASDGSLEKSGEELTEGESNDLFDKVESASDQAHTQNMPHFMRHLDLKEKKQVRCFLPQLIGQLLASHSVEAVPSFLTPHEPIRLGIGLVGVKLRFVSMMLKDQAQKIEFPTPADIEKTPSVRPYVYLTHELNLFKRDHLLIFFEVLFALRKFSLSE